MQSFFNVNLQSIQQNFNLLQKSFSHSFVAPVLKANAYGHGDVQVASALRSAGASVLALGRLDEVQKLKQAGDGKDLLYLGAFDSGDLDQMIELSKDGKLILTLSSIEQLKLLPKDHSFRIHLKFDTGMARLGFPAFAEAQGFYGRQSHGISAASCFASLIEELQKAPNLKVEGWFTHLHSAETHWDQNEIQKMDQVLMLKEESQFLKALFTNVENPTLHQLGLCYWLDQFLRKTWPMAVVHAHNTAGTLALLEIAEESLTTKTFKKMGIRPGLGIFGIFPTEPKVSRVPLRPALSLWARVVMVKKVRQGQGVSYGHTWRATRDTWIGVIPVGYGDGYPRLLSNQGSVLLKGHQCPIVGNVCMDYFMVDLTSLGESAENSTGEKGLILGPGISEAEQISLWSVAQKTQTIPWEILTRLTGRIQRVYQE